MLMWASAQVPERSSPRYRRRCLAVMAAGSSALVFVVGVLVSSILVEADTARGAEGAQSLAHFPDYVADDVCAGCHAAKTAAWARSHHAHAMEAPSDASVRGDFGNATFEAADARYRFFQRDGRYFVETVGPDGEADNFEIAYTFGWTPLQQYLVELDGGRLQALTVAWDTEANRWFDLAESDPAPPGDPLHWTGRENNWNFRCADCHSTDLKRNYDLGADSFQTTYSTVNVGCQACHGPGSNHVAWARAGGVAEGSGANTSKGLVIALGGDQSAEINSCARCHSRRRPITGHYVAGEPFLDHYVPELLDEGLYFPDGQILEEVYVYGSFLQSRMYRAGVSCSDCHEPHSEELRAEGNAVCTACHNEAPPDRFASIEPLPYDSSDHHFHETGEPGSFCVDCHMPARTYMTVDPRRDHSFRIPRPDLSAKIGAPDACTGCHTDRDADWAAAEIAEWYGAGRRREPHFGEAVAIGRAGAPGAGEQLAALATDGAQPAIARATAIELLRHYLDEATGPTVVEALGDTDPMVRIAALRALEATDPTVRVEWAAALLDDPVRAVRITAARILASVPAEMLPGDRRTAYQRAVDEYIASERAAAERPEAHLNLGLYWTARGDAEKAESAYRTALRLAPDFIPALINLSDLQRALGRTDEESELLEQAFHMAPQNPSVLHALGLLRVRQSRHEEALSLVKKAADAAPEVARYAYVYSVALESLGKPDEARRVREAALRRHPYEVDLLVGLLQLQLRTGDRIDALETLDRLIALRPHDSELGRLRQQITDR
jgi:predicted CXXCH cytochrome family protein